MIVGIVIFGSWQSKFHLVAAVCWAREENVRGSDTMNIAKIYRHVVSKEDARSRIANVSDRQSFGCLLSVIRSDESTALRPLLIIHPSS
jgi:hypothetical protein